MGSSCEQGRGDSEDNDIIWEHPSVKTIRCRGSPYEIGRTHGRCARQEILKNIATYTSFFQETAGLTWEQARQKASETFIPVLGREYEEILDEMKGIADGCGNGLSMEDILTLNTRSEIALTCYTDGCTSLTQSALFTSATPSDGDGIRHHAMYLCQNWDWLAELGQGIVLLDIEPQPSHRFDESKNFHMKLLSEAGIVGKIGANSAGFGLCLNAIRSGAFNREGFPVHILIRWMLQHCSTVKEAKDTMDRFGTASTANYLLADRSGDFMDVEASPRGNTTILPKLPAEDEGRQMAYVVHTNHLYGSNRPPKLVDHPAQNSFHRLARIQTLTEKDCKEGILPSFESIRNRLSDQEGYPYSICRDRPAGAVGMERMTTLATIMMEMVSGTIQVIIGRPCLDNLPVVKWTFSDSKDN
ncbi:hypothetical protein A1O1_04552 [Capronia coronata CBS 617.96]|uniref:Peptidase C45 hydrolase domain-containing protein n=1 Tax=Capronia coronata CBS 617.96 TaxID=1182541 RepID=W9YP59_9EURO|nr:uncharacterized protein A1O1_04552 [Capronia coronata CBS 617.96]EXJ91440.1 hypothetical protein A1O1_04552 [Capronia coronata CBS 617.96]